MPVSASQWIFTLAVGALLVALTGVGIWILIGVQKEISDPVILPKPKSS